MRCTFFMVPYFSSFWNQSCLVGTLYCLPQSRGETRTETALREKNVVRVRGRKLVVVFVHFFLLFLYTIYYVPLTSTERGGKFRLSTLLRRAVSLYVRIYAQKYFFSLLLRYQEWTDERLSNQRSQLDDFSLWKWNQWNSSRWNGESIVLWRH